MSLAAAPQHSRLWIFALTEELSAAQVDKLAASMAEFFATWSAHGAPVSAAAEIKYGRFLLVAADGQKTEISGCAIDALFRAVSAAVTEVGGAVADGADIFYRRDQQIARASRVEFAQACRAGQITAHTPVFDNTLSQLSGLNERWELPFSAAWHARAFSAGSAQ